ncbi:MAG: hypothetical protein J5X22_00720 [Candidatus Accumulibacter sp.]|uniref:Uncharacterized protein n=1 Tax=Candidatus Accumulibacter cognatus TaxID=2954383 RepID=A0A7D5SN54_9PROT|nr:hypothetical protein [Accumulibacter sp.]MBN8516658.1 hypothetical protein [Accumulibacter sp.]MBO3709080.1 hypothetical protein [Accumulibacter sp.]QLH50221.1 MAG: hypothetical protein HWD57_10850 [Candidatus Accumulibacter cognatus]
MSNLLSDFLSLLPGDPLLVGEVSSIADEIRIVTLPDGSTITAKGVAGVGQKVFVRGGVIHGIAPTLPIVEILV